MEKAYRLHIENFLSISEMNLDLTPGVQGFVGENAAGKTNILTAVQSILSGKHDEKLIKDGAERSEIRLEEIDENGEVVACASRIQTKYNSRLAAKLPANVTPKIWLTRLLDEVAINPIRLISDDPVKYLKQHLPVKFEGGDQKTIKGVDVVFNQDESPFDECERIAADISVERKAAMQNVRHIKEIVAELEKGLEPLPELPDVAEDVLMTQKKVIDDQLGSVKKHEDEKFYLRDNIKKIDDSIQKTLLERNQRGTWIIDVEKRKDDLKRELADKIAELKIQYSEKEKDVGIKQLEWEKEKAALQERLSGYEDLKKQTFQKIEDIPVIDVTGLHNKNCEIIEQLDLYSDYRSLKERHDRVDSKKKTLGEFEDRHKEFDGLYKWYAYELPKILIGRAKLPVGGLEFRDGELYVLNRHIDRLSSAERHMVAIDLAVALAKSKGHIAICVDGIEILDEKNRDQFMKAVKESGIRVIYTRHGQKLYDHETEIKKQS